MNIKNKITTFVIGLLLTTASFGQTKVSVKDYLGLAKPILFDNNSYDLAWSSHQTDNFYYQEYLAKGDTLEKFKRLITIQVTVGKITTKDIVTNLIIRLDKLKKTNPVINYETFEKDGEIMIDFLMSENTSDGKYLNVVERNVYRYKTITDKNGQKAVLLFGVGDRAYGDDIEIFFSNLKEHRFDLINAVGAFDIPEIIIAK